MHSPVLRFARSATSLCGFAAVAVTIAACAGDSGSGSDTASADASADLSPVDPQIIDVTAGDYFYTLADTISSGATTFRLATTGQEMHHVQLVRLDDGHTLEEMLSAPMDGPPPAWVQFVGGPNAPVPNSGQALVTVNLAPGNYGLLCMIPSPDGMPHVAKGMSKTLVVTPATTVAALPAVTMRMTLTDYDFVMDTPLKSGAQIIEVQNAAEQPHEVLIARLAPGATAEQLLQWIEKPEGPPPGEPMGGTVGLSSGITNYVHTDLSPGEYALLCFLPDAKDGRPHFAHGMMKQITVM